MLGRNCTRLLARLLALSLLTLTQPLLRGQSDQPRADFPFPRMGPRSGPTPREPGFPLRPILPPGTIGFQQIAHSAGTIFSGTVTGITRHPATRPQEVETVAITFHVERAIRGASPGTDLTVSQWMGLWSSGQRYRVGEHLLLFLYPPSKLGLTSSVGAEIGRFRVDPAGRVLLSAQQLSAFRADPVLAGKSRVSVNDLAVAVQRTAEEE
jgi:hypothetical protein